MFGAIYYTNRIIARESRFNLFGFINQQHITYMSYGGRWERTNDIENTRLQVSRLCHTSRQFQTIPPGMISLICVISCI